MDEETAKKINIDDLAKPEEELSADDEKNVTGGYLGGLNVAMGDGSVRSISSGISGNPIGGALSTDDPKKSG